MKHIDYDEIQKAVEDTERSAFDYFLDITTGEVIILAEDIITRAQEILGRAYDDDSSDFEDVEPDEVPEIPEWMEDEIELALDIFMYEQEQYVRIPERDPKNAYAAMKAFAETIEDPEIRDNLLQMLDGQGSFRSFKDALNPWPKIKKRWYGFNAKATRKEIEAWLTKIQSADSKD